MANQMLRAELQEARELATKRGEIQVRLSNELAAIREIVADLVSGVDVSGADALVLTHVWMRTTSRDRLRAWLDAQKCLASRRAAEHNSA